MCHVYHVIMPAVKRIPVTEPVWRELSEMRSAGQTYAEFLEDMIEERKKRRLEEDIRGWHSRKADGFVPLPEIGD